MFLGAARRRARLRAPDAAGRLPGRLAACCAGPGSRGAVRRALRRTWWVWLGVLAIDVAAALNYRLNYYDPAPAPGAGDVVHALGRSLVRTLVPTALGFHDPRTGRFSALSLVSAASRLVALVGWLLRHPSRRLARAWCSRPAAGCCRPWLLVLNRVAHLRRRASSTTPSTSTCRRCCSSIGVLEAGLRPPASRAEARGAHRPGPAAARPGRCSSRWRRTPGRRTRRRSTSCPPGATPDVRREGPRVGRASGWPTTGRSPWSTPTSRATSSRGFRSPGNRADRVLGVIAPPLVFDRPEDVLYRVGPTGELVPVAITLLETDSGHRCAALRWAPRTASPGPRARPASPRPTRRRSCGRCPSALEATDLLVRTMASVDRDHDDPGRRPAGGLGRVRPGQPRRAHHRSRRRRSARHRLRPQDHHGPAQGLHARACGSAWSRSRWARSAAGRRSVAHVTPRAGVRGGTTAYRGR